jgi:hypothetical protein
MEQQPDGDDLDEADGPDGLVPYAVDFTPAMLGAKLGENRVLPWLLERAAKSGGKGAFITQIMRNCLHRVPDERDRRDMASHVFQGLQNYGLVLVDAEGNVRRTTAGDEILGAESDERDRVFARHILTRCNGYRLVEAIQRFELRGERATLEVLTEELDRSATSKSLSTMKAWLQRAGVMKAGKGYAVDEAGLERVLGTTAKRLLGLELAEVEFLLAGRVLAAQQSDGLLEAADVRLCAEMRAPGVKIPGKNLGNFVRGLVQQGLLEAAGTVRSRGGNRVAVRLSSEGFNLSDEQVRAFVAQSTAGYLLSDLKRLDEILVDVGGLNANAAGRLGEMLAVHVCLMLGLTVVGWRHRAPAEIDLTAERITALGYQRWHVQVKNTGSSLDIDQVDREVGVSVGTGATHLLFVVPRGGISAPARAEIRAKSTLTHLHIFVLDSDAFKPPVKVATLLKALRGQEAGLARLKRIEAERRERL